MKAQWNEIAGYGLIVGAACFFGGSATLGKTLMFSGISTVMLMQIRSVCTSLILLLLLFSFARTHLRISKRDIPAFLILGIPGLALVNASYYYAVKTLPIAVAIFIQLTSPVVIFLYGWITKREAATKSKLLALILSLAGTYLMVKLHETHGVELPLAGLASAVVAMLTYAFYVVYSHRLGQKHSPWTIIFFGYTAAAIFWCLVQNVTSTAHRLSEHHLWSLGLLFTLFSTVIPFSMFLSGLRRVTPTGASIAGTCETISATLFAYFVLGENLSPGQIAGAVLILSAVVLLIYKSQTIPVLEER